MLYKPENKELPWECVDECPNGYLPNSDDTECVKCNKSCPKGEKQEFNALSLNFQTQMAEDEITNGSEDKEKPEPTNQPDKQSTTRTKPKQLNGCITLSCTRCRKSK